MAKDIYSMTDEDFRAKGIEDGTNARGNAAAAFEKVASEADIIAYFGLGVMKRIAYVQGFSTGFGA
jgi:hypothetical protein